jgi:hypothetical protein
MSTPPGDPEPKPVTKADLLGCWKLVEAVETRDGVYGINKNLGPDPLGYLHYLPEGRVAVTVAVGGRKPMSGSRRHSPIEEMAASAQTFDAYAGTFSLLGPNRIAHHIEISTYQNDVGTDLIRDVTIEDDVIKLSIPLMFEDGQWVKKWLAWRRVAALPAG